MSWTPEKIAERFEECVWVLNKIPGGKGTAYANYWPEIIYTSREISRQPPRRLSVRPLPDAIDRMEETLTWIQWVKEDYRELIWQRALGVPLREIAGQMGMHHSTVDRIWKKELQEITRNL